MRRTVLLLALLLPAACRRQATPAPSPTASAAPAEDPAERARREAEAREAARRAEAERERLARETAERARAAARDSLLASVYFEFDRSDLDVAARTLLDAKLAVLRANANVRVRIAGHADERGSDEYNLALGQRRAAAAKRYLTQHGVAEDRFDIVSFGEERPECGDADESCWVRNRRDAFEIVVGTIASGVRGAPRP